MCTDFGPDRLWFARLIPERVKKSQYNRLSVYNNNNSDDMVEQHLDYVQRTWLDSTVWPPSAWSAFKQPARTNNDVNGWHARLNSRDNHGRLNMYQLLYLLHEEVVLVNIGVRLLSDAGTSRLQRKKYTCLHSRLSTMWDEYDAGRRLLTACSRAVKHM